MASHFRNFTLSLGLLVLLFACASMAYCVGYRLFIQTPWQAVVFFILAPLLEELVFRAQLQPFLSERLGHQPALWLASGVFALAHAPWMGLWAIGVFLPGVILGLCWQRYRQLWRNVLWHSLFNTSLAIVSLLAW